MPNPVVGQRSLRNEFRCIVARRARDNHYMLWSHRLTKASFDDLGIRLMIEGAPAHDDHDGRKGSHESPCAETSDTAMLA